MAEEDNSEEISVMEVHPAGDDEIEYDINEDGSVTVSDVKGEDKVEVDNSSSHYDVIAPHAIEVSTIEGSIDDYLDDKRAMIAEKIGVALENIDSNVGGAVMVYLMSGTMLRSGLAMMCYEASGGDDSDADDVAAIIEAVSSVSCAREEILEHDYAGNINDSVRTVTDAPGALLRGDFGFIGDAISAIAGSPKAMVDGVNLAKAAVGDTIAEVWRGDYTKDSAYITQIKAGNGIAMSTACKAGSEKAGREECVELCHLYGRNFAVAYAIAEDTCKMISCVESNDLEFEMGLSIAYALDQCGANALIGDVDNKKLFKELKRSDNLEDAKLRMMIVYNKYARAAVNAAKRLPDSIYKDMLVAMPNHIFNGIRKEYGVEDVF